MKTTTIRSIAMILFAVTVTASVKAQSENTSEPLITQLKNGTAPGLLFSPEKPASTPTIKINENVKESLIMQIRKGTAPGMRFLPVATGGTAVAATALRTAATAPQPLASEKQAGAVVEQTKVEVVLPKQE